MQFEALFEQLARLDTELGQALGSAPAFAKVREALQQSQSAANNPEAVYQAMNGLSRTLVALLDHVTDGSGLTLDPERASHYLISSALMRTPELIQSTAELRGLGGGSLKAGQLTPQAAAAINERLGVIAHERRMARVDLGKAQAHDAALSTAALDAGEKFEALVRSAFPAGPGEVKGDRDAYVNLANQTLQTQFEQVGQNLATLDTILAERQSGLRRALALIGSVTALGLLLAGFLFMGFYCSTIDGLRILRRHMINIAMGDLRNDIQDGGHDEVSGLLKELRNMQQSLRETVRQVQDASDTVVHSSIEIAHGTHDLAARTESGAAALEQSASALEQTTSTVQLTADSAKQASQIASDNALTASHGGQVMHDVVQTMERIRDSSQKISDIIGVIDGIAFQTNILALNAAVEAARAGEQGRGFAVVATEVRALAGRSAEAAREIKALISSSTAEVESGAAVVREAGNTMREIVEHADRVKQLLDEVANGAREQSQGIAQIGHSVQELDRNTQANAALVEETATAARQQRSAAVRMSAQVDEFRLPGKQAATMVEGIDVDAIIDAHRQWKVKLRNAIENAETVDTKALSRDDCCALGKWIYGDGQRLQARRSFSMLVGKHAHFHQVAGTIGDLINRKEYAQAEDALAPGTPFAHATSDVVLVLSSAKRLGFD